MRVCLVAAVAVNGVIGRQGALPWHLPRDLQYFKSLTLGKPVIMGRKTWESIGRPLPKRHNVVITGQSDYAADGATVVHSPDAALRLLENEPEVMVIGGGGIYRAFLERAERLYLTEVAVEVDGDARFPEFDRREWREVSRETHAADERHAHDYAFIRLDRFGAPTAD